MMPTYHMRIKALYILMGLNVILLFALIGMALYVSSIQRTVTETVASSRASCERGNVVREMTRYMLKRLGDEESLERSRRASLKKQLCKELYPK